MPNTGHCHLETLALANVNVMRYITKDNFLRADNAVCTENLRHGTDDF